MIQNLSTFNLQLNLIGNLWHQSPAMVGGIFFWLLELNITNKAK